MWFILAVFPLKYGFIIVQVNLLTLVSFLLHLRLENRNRPNDLDNKSYTAGYMYMHAHNNVVPLTENLAPLVLGKGICSSSRRPKEMSKSGCLVGGWGRL